MVNQQLLILGKMREIEKEASEWLVKQFDTVIFINDSYDFICKKDSDTFAIEVVRDVHEMSRGQFKRIIEKAGISNHIPLLLYRKDSQWFLDKDYFSRKFKTPEQVKDERNNFLLLLLSSVDEGLTPKAIAKKLGKTKQALNYHLKRMMALKVICRVQSYPYSIYKLTPFGERVKDSLRQSEHLTPLWKVHNLIVGFRIRKMGTFQFVETTRRKVITMNGGWKYVPERIDDYVVNVQDTGLLKIYVPEQYSKDPDITIGEMFSRATHVAQIYVDKYGMTLEPLYVIRKAEKELCKSEALAKIFGRVKLEEMYVNASNGVEALEEPMDSYAIEKLLKLPDVIEKQLTPALEQFSKNIALHLEVLQEIKIAIKKLGEVDKNVANSQ